MMSVMHRATEPRHPLWDRIGALVSGRRCWVLALLIAAIGGTLLGLIPQSGADQQSPVVLPSTAESARVAELLKQFPGGDTAPVLLVITRGDGSELSPEDLAAAQQARDRMAGLSGVAPAPPIPVPPRPNRPPRSPGGTPRRPGRRRRPLWQRP